MTAAVAATTVLANKISMYVRIELVCIVIMFVLNRENAISRAARELYYT